MDAAILHAMKTGSKPKPKVKPLKEFHAKEQSDGKYHVVTHSGKPSEPTNEVSANDLNEVQQALEQHMGTPNDGEQDAEAQPEQMGSGEPAMGGQQ